MKILYVSEAYLPDLGGIAAVIENFTQGLAAEGHDVHLWTRSHQPKSYTETHGGVTIHYQRSTPYPLSSGHRVTVGVRAGLAAIVADWQPDVIHAHIFPSPITAAAITYGKKHHIPVVITNHAMPENYRNVVDFRLPAAAEKLIFPIGWKWLVGICNQATFVTTPTPTALSYLTDNGLKRPGLAISNGIDTDMYRPGPDVPELRRKWRLPSDKPLMLYLGRLDGEKMVEIIIQALPQLQHSYHLVIAGGGNNERQLKALTRKLKLSKHVTFTGLVSATDKVRLYQMADLFVIASPAELQSLVTLEAMSCHLPVVAVNAGALDELCHDGTNGEIFALNDSTDLAGKLDKLLGNPELRLQYGQASRRIVEKAHSLHGTILAYQSVYQQLIATQNETAAARSRRALSGKL